MADMLATPQLKLTERLTAQREAAIIVEVMKDISVPEAARKYGSIQLAWTTATRTTWREGQAQLTAQLSRIRGVISSMVRTWLTAAH